MPLFVAFIDLTKVFDLPCQQRRPFQDALKDQLSPKTAQLNWIFPLQHEGVCAVQRQHLLALRHLQRPGWNKAACSPQLSLGSSSLLSWSPLLAQHNLERIHLRNRSDGRLFNLAHLKVRRNFPEALIRDVLFADDAAVVTYTQRELHLLMDYFSQACKDFGLTISLKKTNILGQDTRHHQSLASMTTSSMLFTSSPITDNLSLDAEVDKRIGKAATTLAHLASRAWTNPKSTTTTKMAVYNACVLSTPLYGSETWTTYVCQEKRLNTFLFRSFWCLLSISWQDNVTNTDVLSRAGLFTMYTLLRKRRLRWLWGHVCCIEDDRIPKDILYGKFPAGQRGVGRPQLRYKDVCKREGAGHQHKLLGGSRSRSHQLEKHAPKSAADLWGKAVSGDSREAIEPAERKLQPTDQNQQTQIRPV